MVAGDPTQLIRTPADAVTAADALLKISRVGRGCRIDRFSSSTIWICMSEGPLAAMLYAASPCGNGEGIRWVLVALDNTGETLPDSTTPGWYQAARIVEDSPLLHDALMRTLAMDYRQRASVLWAMRDALWPWMWLAGRGFGA